MKINKHLNLIIPIERDDGSTVYVHSMPIMPETFDRYFLVISKTFAAIYGEGLGPIAGPRVAAKMLKRVATDMGVWEGEEGVANGLCTEIRRLSSVLLPGPRGWETIPLQEAIDKQAITAEDASEVDNALTFFTVGYSMHRREERRAILEGASKIWGSEISSLSCSEFRSSLKTSTVTEPSGETAVVSSVPH